MTALHRLQEEDPALARPARRRDPPDPPRPAWARPTWPSSTERLARKFGVEVETEDGRRPLPGDHHRRGRGRGQVQEADRRPRPVRRGLRPDRAARARRRASSSSTRSSAAPSPASSSRPCRRASRRPWPAAARYGWPVVDVRVTCFDGKFHPVDSSEMSFKMAGAIWPSGRPWPRPGRSCSSRSPCSRSPCPTAYQGDVMGDLNGRRGRVQGTETGGDGRVDRHRPGPDIGDPALRHRPALDDRRAGAASRAEHDHYDPLPAHLADKMRHTNGS